jgi:hypothetical protein
MSASLPYIVLQCSHDTCCDVHAQTDEEYQGNSMQFGLGTSIAQSLHAVGNDWHADGLSVTNVQSILCRDDEIEVVIVRPDRSRRHNSYPFALFACRSKPRGPQL